MERIGCIKECGCEMELKIIPYSELIDNSLFVIKNVPTFVCENCGEKAYDDNIFKKVKKIIEIKKENFVRLGNNEIYMFDFEEFYEPIEEDIISYFRNSTLKNKKYLTDDQKDKLSKIIYKEEKDYIDNNEDPMFTIRHHIEIIETKDKLIDILYDVGDYNKQEDYGYCLEEIEHDKIPEDLQDKDFITIFRELLFRKAKEQNRFKEIVVDETLVYLLNWSDYSSWR